MDTSQAAALSDTASESGSALALLQRYLRIRKQTELICAGLQPEDYVVQPVVDVSPPKWHLAHSTWFFEQFVLSASKPGYKCFDADYAYLFNSYYENVGKRVLRTDRGNLTRPGVDEIYRYRAYVNAQMQEFLSAENQLPDQLSQVLELGLQHEQQHQELLATDIKYILGHNPLFPALLKTSNAEEVGLPAAGLPSIPEETFVEIPASLYDIGHEGNGFCFDNELGRHQVYLHACKLLDRLVTNREYLEFMQQGGYQDHNLWLAEGWDWVKQQQAQVPMYWHKTEGQWHYYTLHGLKPIDWHAPVTHISYYEADAYARWRGMRLPTEFEWEAACRLFGQQDSAEPNFQDTMQLQPLPRTLGSAQFRGDCWEWTSSAYLPYPYYQKAEGALGEYNGKFMINQMVLRGGSCATPADHFRASYRNFFHAHLRWQFTGIRLASWL